MQFFRVGSILLILISVSHFIGHFVLIPHLQLIHNFTGKLPANEVERQMLTLMNHYHKKVGGENISMMDIQNGLSFCYGLFFLWAGVLNLLLLKGLVRNKRLLMQISLFNAAILAIGGVISIGYFFWLPVASFFVTAVLFAIAAFKLPKHF
jgi:hypothetical protein